MHLQYSSDSINKRLKLSGDKVLRDGWDLLLGLNLHNFLNFFDLNLFKQLLDGIDFNLVRLKSNDFGGHNLNRLFHFHNLNRHERHELRNVLLIDEVVVLLDPAVDFVDNLVLGLVQILGQLVDKLFELVGGIIVLFSPAVKLGIKLVFDGVDVFG